MSLLKRFRADPQFQSTVSALAEVLADMRAADSDATLRKDLQSDGTERLSITLDALLDNLTKAAPTAKPAAPMRPRLQLVRPVPMESALDRAMKGLEPVRTSDDKVIAATLMKLIHRLGPQNPMAGGPVPAASGVDPVAVDRVLRDLQPVPAMADVVFAATVMKAVHAMGPQNPLAEPPSDDAVFAMSIRESVRKALEADRGALINLAKAISGPGPAGIN